MSDLSLEEIQALQAENERLKAERDTERAAREAEQRRADGLDNSVRTKDREIAAAQVSGFAAQEAQADASIVAIGNERVALKKQLSDLNAEGKFEEAADVQEKMSDAAARLHQAQQAKTFYAQKREQAAAQPVDPVDRFLALNDYSEAEREWIKKNPRFATDRDFQARVTAAHADLVKKGIAPQSQRYFEGLEQAGYMRQPVAREEPQHQATGGAIVPEGGDPDNPYSEGHVVEEPVVQTPPARPAARSSVAAGPTHRAPASQQPRQNQEMLTREEAEAALAMSEYMPPEVQAEGEAAIYAHYLKAKKSPMATRLKSEWASGG